MARFDLCANPTGAGYLLIVQSDLLDHLNTRMVVPLLPLAQAPQPARILNPVFAVGAESFVMATQFMAAVPTAILKEPVASLDQRRDEIVAALDFLMQGF